MRGCGTFRHVCHFQQSLDPHIQICACGEMRVVFLLGDARRAARQHLVGVLEARIERLDAIEEQQEAERIWRGTHAPGSIPPWLSARDYHAFDEDDGFYDDDLPF